MECDKNCKTRKQEAIAAYYREYYQANKEAYAAYYREYRKAHKEAYAAYYRKYYKANKEAIVARKREYREANKEAYAAYMREYYKANKEKFKEKGAILRCVRKKRSYSQEALGRLLGVSKSTISRWESGELPYDAQIVSRIFPELAEVD